MKYLLDTNICVYFLNKKVEIIDKLRTISSDDLAISIITLAELQYGAYNSSYVENNMKRLVYFERAITNLPLTPAITEQYAKIKSVLRKSGQPVDDFDILIGATAISHSLTLVTNNERHFHRMDGIVIENWLQ